MKTDSLTFVKACFTENLCLDIHVFTSSIFLSLSPLAGFNQSLYSQECSLGELSQSLLMTTTITQQIRGSPGPLPPSPSPLSGGNQAQPVRVHFSLV